MRRKQGKLVNVNWRDVIGPPISGVIVHALNRLHCFIHIALQSMV